MVHFDREVRCFAVFTKAWIQNMIELTKMDQRIMLLNEDMIETIEETPDTVVSLSNGHRYIVMESMQDIMERIKDFKGGH